MLLACDKCGFSSLNDIIIQYFRDLFYNADRKDGLSLRKYIFPDKYLLRNKKIYIYGAGAVGRDFYDDFSQDTGIELMGIVDRDWQTISLDAIEVQPVDELQKAAFDYVVIAVYSPAVAERIVQHLCQMGISKEKIVYQRPKRILDL
jgi:FlaA1/EpsC-like NDP-sugar epimerase